MPISEVVGLALALAGLAAWLAVGLAPDLPWLLRPVGEDEPPPPEPDAWPSVRVVVPARNEAAYLPRTLPSLLAQDYPGACEVVVVDDRSADETALVARRSGARVVDGEPLPRGWVGKVWALEQGAAGASADYLLLTDADIRHARGSLRRLVAEAEAGRLALVSRMARLRCRTRAERLLLPPFVFFFNLLYPMRRANDPRRRLAAAAGGCLLVRRDALELAGGLAAIGDAVIDDLALARRVKALGEPIRLAVSRRDVESLREHATVRDVGKMVARTAFAELRYSWALTAATLAGLTLLFPLQPALVVGGLFLGWPVVAAALAAWLCQTALVLPTVRLYRISPVWAASLPLAGTLYAGMTLVSAVRGRDTVD